MLLNHSIPTRELFYSLLWGHHKVLAMVANQAHNLEVEGSSPSLVTNIINMMQIINAPNLRQLIRKANELGLTKEEIVTIQQSQDQFYLVYYNK